MVTWNNDAPPALSAENLNQMSADLATALGVPDGALAARLADATSQAYAQVKTIVRKGDRWANVTDYFDPNRVAGTTDDRSAFETARLTGKPVWAPTGHYYLSKAPAWGDNTICVGDGKGRTVIHLLNSATKDADVFANANLAGNVQMYFADMTLDGNVMRGPYTTGSGGSRGSCLVFRNVKNFYVDRVSAINPVLHGFDVTYGSLDYAYLGDGNTVAANLRSSEGYYDQCDSTNFGDDGFTCHSSDYINYSRCFAYDPRERSNCNGFEVDGDSFHITMTGTRSQGCYGGVEVKGHNNESSGQDVIINGHRDFGSVRSFNFRHIGFHSPTDPTSQTARHITASNLVSIWPNNDKGFQDDLGARSLAISAFHGVTINGFISIGRGGYTTSDYAIALQFKAGHIVLAGVHITGWGGAAQDVGITTADNVSFLGLHTRNSAARAVYIGAGVTSASLQGMNLTAPATGATIGVEINNSADGVELGGTIAGYPTAVLSDDISYGSLARWQRRIRNVPAGITSMKDLDPGWDYYASSTFFPTFTIDRPAPAATAGGAYFIIHTGNNVDSCIQTLYRNTFTAGQAQYWRVLNVVTKTAGPWNQVNITAVAYSTT